MYNVLYTLEVSVPLFCPRTWMDLDKILYFPFRCPPLVSCIFIVSTHKFYNHNSGIQRRNVTLFSLFLSDKTDMGFPYCKHVSIMYIYACLHTVDAHILLYVCVYKVQLLWNDNFKSLDGVQSQIIKRHLLSLDLWPPQLGKENLLTIHVCQVNSLSLRAEAHCLPDVSLPPNLSQSLPWKQRAVCLSRDIRRQWR